MTQTSTSHLPPSRFVPETLTVKAASGREYVLRQLNAREQMNCDKLDESMTAAMYYRIAMAIESIDGRKTPPPASDLALTSVLEAVPGSDMNELILAVANWTIPKGADLKNASTPVD
jgi:hypothetical protein